MSSLSSPPQTQQLTALPWPQHRDFSLKCCLHGTIPAGTYCLRLRLGRKTHVPGGMEEAVICAGLSGWRREDAFPDGCFLRNWLAGSWQHRQPSQQAVGCHSHSMPALPAFLQPSHLQEEHPRDRDKP